MPARLVAYSKSVQRARHPVDVLNELDRIVARTLGVRVYGAWWVLVSEAEPDYLIGRNVFIHSSVSKAYVAEFLQLYAKYGTSPLGREARLNGGPATWSELARRLKLTGTDRWFLDLTQRHGMRDGMHCAQGDVLVSYHAKKVLKLTEENRAILNAGAQLAASHLKRVMVGKRSASTPELTAREVAALRWYSLGEEPAEIAGRMGVGVGSVNTYLDRAKKKLNAKSRAHAVRIAIFSRLLGGVVVVGRLLGEPWWL